MKKDLILSEETFEKAIQEQNLEVYNETSMSKFAKDLENKLLNKELSSQDIEKARKDLSKLVKVTKVDKNGKKSVV
jgi:hypothetical protein